MEKEKERRKISRLGKLRKLGRVMVIIREKKDVRRMAMKRGKMM